MKLLVLGGTSFVGRHIVEAALDAGHDVTLFNRGVSNPGLFPDCEHRRGDREAGDLASLSTGEWDGVIDVNGYTPRDARDSTALLDGRVGWYTFVSSMGVYPRPARDPIGDGSPLVPAADPDLEARHDRDAYGPMKVACEHIVRARYGARCSIVRPGLVVGPYDTSDRFTWFVRRVARGVTIVAPGRPAPPAQPVQLVHARDLGEFCVHVTGRTSGAFNAVGPTDPTTLADVLAACAQAAGVEPDFVWVDEEFLEQRKAKYPRPPHWPAFVHGDGFLQTSVAGAAAAGLRNRPLVEIAASTLAWDRTRDQDAPLGDGRWLTLDRERELLDEWNRSRTRGSVGS